MHVKPSAKPPIAILFLLFNSKDYPSDSLRKVRKNYRINELVHMSPFKTNQLLKKEEL
jgi:hypothetical protein